MAPPVRDRAACVRTAFGRLQMAAACGRHGKKAAEGEKKRKLHYRVLIKAPQYALSPAPTLCYACISFFLSFFICNDIYGADFDSFVPVDSAISLCAFLALLSLRFNLPTFIVHARPKRDVSRTGRKKSSIPFHSAQALARGTGVSSAKISL